MRLLGGGSPVPSAFVWLYRSAAVGRRRRWRGTAAPHTEAGSQPDRQREAASAGAVFPGALGLVRQPPQLRLGGRFYAAANTKWTRTSRFFPSQARRSCSPWVLCLFFLFFFFAKVVWTQRICTVLVVLFVLFCVVSLCLSKPSRTQFPVRNYSGRLSLALSCRFREKGAFVLLNCSWAKGSRPEASVLCVYVQPNTDYDLIKERLWMFVNPLAFAFGSYGTRQHALNLAESEKLCVTVRRTVQRLARTVTPLMAAGFWISVASYSIKEISELILFFSRILLRE